MYVAYTYPSRGASVEADESYDVHLYSIVLDSENMSLLEDGDQNIFDSFVPEIVFSGGANGKLHFDETDGRVYLGWSSKPTLSSPEIRSYSFDCEDRAMTWNLESSHSGGMPAKGIMPESGVRYYRHPEVHDLYAAVIEPVNVHELKCKSPAVVVCLGGPDVPIPQFSDENSIYRKLSREGFYVIVPLRRGVMGISREWENAIVGNYGKADVEDIVTGTRFVLSALSDVIDDKRIGLYGASYGGYSALLIAGKYDLFSAVVSHCGVSDLIGYPLECHGYDKDVMMTYAGTDELESYQAIVREISPYEFIENWTAPVLLVHTIDDSSVWFGQSVRAYNKGLLLGKDVELLLAPGPHSYDIPHGDQLIKYMIRFLRKNIDKSIN